MAERLHPVKFNREREVNLSESIDRLYQIMNQVIAQVLYQQ